jgi:hypothetical protein
MNSTKVYLWRQRAIYIVTRHLNGTIAELGTRPLLGSDSINNTVTATVVTSRNSRRAAGSGVATLSGARSIVPLQWNTWYHVTYIDRETMFSVRFVQWLYLENRNKRCGMLTHGVVLLHDIARKHTLLTLEHCWSISTGSCLTTLFTALISL